MTTTAAKATPEDEVVARFLELDTLSNVEVARWTLQELRYLSSGSAPVKHSTISQFGFVFGRIPLTGRRAVARKLIAGIMELDVDEAQEVAQAFRAILPALHGGRCDSSPLAVSMAKVIGDAKQASIPAAEKRALREAVQEEAARQIRANPLTVSAAFRDMSEGERRLFVDELAAAGLLDPEQRGAAEALLSPETHSLLAFVVLAHELRWFFAILPAFELLAVFTLPREGKCSWFATCEGDTCGLPRWLLLDGLVWLFVSAAASAVAQSCGVLLDRFRSDSVGMTQRFRAAYQSDTVEAQAKALGIDAEILQSARRASVLLVAGFAVGTLLTVWGILAVCTNLLACKFATFIIVTAFVCLRVFVLAVGLLLIGNLLISIRTADGERLATADGGNTYGTMP